MSDYEPASSPPSYYTGNHSAVSSRTTLHAPLSNQAEPAALAYGDVFRNNNVALTWDGVNEHESLPAASSQPGSPSSLSSSPLPRTPSPFDLYRLPEPTHNVVYTFSPIGHNAMVLIPPEDAPDTRPRYYISVQMNCFMPLSHITTIYRGARESDANVVAEFEMGITDASSRVKIGEHKVRPVGQLLSKDGKRENAIWTWILPGARGPEHMRARIYWEYDKRPCFCMGVVNSKRVVLAKFHPHMDPRLQHTTSRLEVTPGGHAVFDDILLSLLVVERKRLSPTTKDRVLKLLFNN